MERRDHCKPRKEFNPMEKEKLRAGKDRALKVCMQSRGAAAERATSKSVAGSAT